MLKHLTKIRIHIVIFHLILGNKQSYPLSIGPHFITDRLTEEQKPLRDNFVRTQLESGEQIVVRKNKFKNNFKVIKNNEINI